LEDEDNVSTTTVEFASTEYALLTASLLAFIINFIVMGVIIFSSNLSTKDEGKDNEHSLNNTTVNAPRTPPPAYYFSHTADNVQEGDKK